MRLFVAVLPPPAAVAELRTVVDELRNLPGADKLRWTEPAGWHFTLAFLGDVRDEARPRLEERLRRAAHRTPPFELALYRSGRFGQRALWAGVRGEVATLRRLAERAYAAGSKAGLALEDTHRFVPHLTLARSGEGRHQTHPPLVDLLPYAAELDGFAGEPWTADRLSLVRSHLPTSGIPGERPRYEEVGHWPLEGKG
ncbi:RNA 2',3'-cyclic phosphodiesterase [Streptomyces indicus]|uniref:RNA 2',3'-cyclic phosphodiesterase n=1 Tax=Streptomyces indicus TaxID=417292 RepID=A0A1G9HV89_9ACTN|nr:RNA 2',3'-cyclic phosphodiesterase [Streptomyces indicus]SDL16483.1 2'-5' RNA ligase [Streptomyces indicus]